jgi:hypothetical protein
MKISTIPLLILILVIFSTCKKEENTITATVPPDIEFSSDDNDYQNGNMISGAAGQTMTVRATFTDEVGIKSFRIAYPEWHLDNNIDLATIHQGETLKTYAFEYNFLIPEDADNAKNHNIQLVVTNLGNLSTEADIIVTLDGDYESPVIFNEFPGNNSTVPEEGLALRFDVTDNKGLKFVVVEFPQLGFYDSISEFEDPKSFSYEKNLNLPGNESYEYAIRAEDHFTNGSASNLRFTVGIPTITHMFLVDESTQEALDKYLIGPTIKMEPTATENEHSVVYYCAEPGTELRFMENFYSFSNANFLFGVDGTNLVKDGMDSPYVLNQKGYYWITINTDALTFDISGPVAPDDLTDARTIPTPPFFYGRGVDGFFGGWDTWSDYMTIDQDNKYFFHLETQLGDAENNGYCEGSLGIELNGNTEWDDEFIEDGILWFGYHWFQDGVIDDIDENGGKPEGWAGLAGQLETWSYDEENYWNVWADMTVTYHITQDMYTRQTRVFAK